MSVLKVQDVSVRYITGDFKDIGLKEYVLRRIRHDYHVREFWANRHISFTLEPGLIYGFLGSLVGIFGDLCFSVVKRQTGVKDYGNLIPGHGGILDRFDSMMMVAPLTEVLLLLIPVVVA